MKNVLHDGGTIVPYKKSQISLGRLQRIMNKKAAKKAKKKGKSG